MSVTHSDPSFDSSQVRPFLVAVMLAAAAAAIALFFTGLPI
jgi:hypothetical protein